MQFLKRWIEKRSGFNLEVVPVTDSALDPDLDRMLVRHQYGAAERGVTRLSLFSLTWSAHQEIPKSAYFGSHEVAADLDD